MLLLNALDV